MACIQSVSPPYSDSLQRWRPDTQGVYTSVVKAIQTSSFLLSSVAVVSAFRGFHPSASEGMRGWEKGSTWGKHWTLTMKILERISASLAALFFFPGISSFLFVLSLKYLLDLLPFSCRVCLECVWPGTNRKNFLDLWPWKFSQVYDLIQLWKLIYSTCFP